MRKTAIILPLLSALCAGCGDKDKAAPAPDADIVAQYRDSVLRVSDVVRQMPAGIEKADSIALAHAIIDGWIEGFLIEDLAWSQVDDKERIDELTERYRRSLIADSYRRKMRSKGVQPIDVESVHAYYRQHMSEMRLERPILKGLFIRVPESSRHLDEIRRWMSNPGPDTYDALENVGLKEAVTFRYFADQWIDFDVLAGEIPYRFGDADSFVRSTTDFETVHNGVAYILHITEYRPSGDLMPEEYAAPLIEDRIKASNLSDYEHALMRALRKSAIEKNILKEGNYSR